MTTNAEFLKADAAIKDYKQNLYSDIIEAAQAHAADTKLTTIMLGNENVLTEDVMIEESGRQSRVNTCMACDQLMPDAGMGTCNQCACPISFITNIKLKTCPLGKW